MTKNNEQVSYKLMERWEITQYLEKLHNLPATKKNLRQTVQALRGMGTEVIPVLLKLLGTAEEQLFTFVAYALEVLGDESIIPDLTQVLLDPALDDWRKSQIMTILQALGVDPLDLPVDSMFQDLDEAMNASLVKVLQDIRTNIYNVPMVVAEIGKLPADVFPVVVEELVREGTRPACILLYYLAQVDNESMSLAAIKGLEQTETPIALRLLEDLQGQPVLADKVERYVHKLRFKGIKVWQRPLNFLPKVGQLFDVSVSAVDYTGSHVVFFAWYALGRKQMLTTVNLLINANSGLVDCWGTSNLSIKEYYDIKADFNDTMFVVSSNWDYGLRLISNALYHSHRTKQPLPWEWSFWQKLLPEQSLVPQPLALQLPDTSVDQVMLAESDILLDLPLFNGWTIINQQVVEVAQRVVAINESKMEHKHKVRLRISLFNQLMASLFGEKTQQWKDRIASTIDFCQQNKLELPYLQALHNLYAAIGAIPFESIPFFSRLLLDSLQRAIHHEDKGTSV